MNAAISMKNVTKRFDTFTLDHVSFDIPKGTIVGLVGENGAGKTTLLKCIMQMLFLDEGEIFIDGKSARELPPQWKEEVGVILAGVGFASTMTAENMGRTMEGVYRNWQSDTYRNYLQRFKINPKKKIKDYSKGMQMKLNLAVALSHEAKLLIFDEATSGLDPVVRDDILDILLEFIQDEEHAALISSHIISDLERVADYMAFLHEGRLEFCANKDEMLYAYGVVRCTRQECEQIPREQILGIRKNHFGCDVMVRDKHQVRLLLPHLNVDDTDIEEIILFMVKGERI